MGDGPIELRDLRYFTLAAQMQHISRTAAAPGVSQPFLTKIIRQLENELGAPLFDHTGRGVTLSPCGKLVYEKSQTILALVDALHDDVDDLRDLPIVTSPKGGGIRGDLDLLFCTARPSAEHRLRAGGRQHRCDDGLTGGGACGVMNVSFMDHPVWGRYCRRHNTELGGEVALCWNRRLTQQPSAQRFIAFAQTFFAGLLQYQKTE